MTAESLVRREPESRQFSLFDDPETTAEREKREQTALEKERIIQKTSIALKRKFGKNAILKAIDLKEEATAIERNRQVGGHFSGEEP